MRHVKLPELRRLGKREWFDALEKAQQDMAGLGTDEERRDYIRKNSSSWTVLKHVLWMLGSGKCWYSEKRLQADEGEVEHFRPKSDVWKSALAGYWWLTFDWQNFRFAHPSVNKTRTDYATEETAGKGCYFPLEDEATRATCAMDMGNENPVLLDPTRASDCYLLWFIFESGVPEPRIPENVDRWKHRRAKESIKYYHLDDGTWNSDRADLMKAVAIVCDKIIGLGNNPAAKDYDALVEELLGYVNPFSEFTAAAFQVIREKGLFEAGSPLRP